MKAFINEIRTNLFLQVVVVLVTAIMFALVSLARADSDLLSSVQAGEIKLQCEFRDGVRIVDPAKVVGYYPDNNYWKFVNGGARNCVTLPN